MGLVRDTMVVGAATFIVGSVLMEVSVKEKSGEPVGWWPYVGTFVAGALGYYFVRATNVVKASESFEAISDDYRISAKRMNPLSRHYIPPSVNDAESFSAESYDFKSWNDVKEMADAKCPFCVRSALVVNNEEGYSFSVDEADEAGDNWLLECSNCGAEWNQDGECTLDREDLLNAESFSAETFEAKARRRTRFAWAIGKDPISPPNDDYQDHTHRDYMKYHIKGLPPGYFIHLSKYEGYGKNYWETNFKSPHSTSWTHELHHRKSDATKAAIEWYNIQVAKPETQDLTPMQKMMISKGKSKRKFALHMTDTTKPIYTYDSTKGKTVVSGEEHTLRFYIMGGLTNMKPFEFATIRHDKLDIQFPQNQEAFDFVLPFIQGMIYLPNGKMQGIRSVNHYNKNRQSWINKHPAWFKNMAKHKLSILIEKHGSGIGGWLVFRINGIDFVRFGKDTTGSEATYKDGKKAIYGTGLQEYFVKDTQEWKELRPTTQKKLFAKALAMRGTKQEDLHGNMLVGRLFLLYVDKLNPFQPDTGYVKIYPNPRPNKEGFLVGNYGKFVKDGAELMARRYRPKV